METLKIKRFGWRPGLPNKNAPKFSQMIGALAAVPTSVDLRSFDNPIYDQGDLGSCTANALGGLIQFVLKKENKPAFVPSRLWIYYNERAIEGTINSDAGAAISDGIHVVSKLGAPHESLWWYNTAKFAVKPSAKVYADGLLHKSSSYLGLDNTNITELKSCLAMGYPFVFGVTVFNEIESASVAKTGIVPMPGKNESPIGGHALMAVGYDDANQWFIVRNSWGADWGANGYCFLPYAYLTDPNLCQDVWTIHTVS